MPPKSEQKQKSGALRQRTGEAKAASFRHMSEHEHNTRAGKQLIKQKDKVLLFEKGVHGFLDAVSFCALQRTNSFFKQSGKNKEENYYKDQIEALIGCAIPAGKTAKSFFQEIYQQFLAHKPWRAHLTHLFTEKRSPLFVRVPLWVSKFEIPFEDTKFAMMLTPYAAALFYPKFSKLPDSILKSFTDPAQAACDVDTFIMPHDRDPELIDQDLPPLKVFSEKEVLEWNQKTYLEDKTVLSSFTNAITNRATIAARIKDGQFVSHIAYETACFILDKLIFVYNPELISLDYMRAIRKGISAIIAHHGLSATLPKELALAAFDRATKNLSGQQLDSLVRVSLRGVSRLPTTTSIRSELLPILFNNGAAINNFGQAFFSLGSYEETLLLFTNELMKAVLLSKDFTKLFAIVQSNLDLYKKFEIERWNMNISEQPVDRNPLGLRVDKLVSLKAMAKQQGSLEGFEKLSSLLHSIRSQDMTPSSQVVQVFGAPKFGPG